MSADVKTYIVDIPLVGIAQQAGFIVVVQAAKIVEAELKAGSEVSEFLGFGSLYRKIQFV